MAIALTKSNLTIDQIKIIANELTVKPKKTQYNDNPDNLCIFSVNNKEDKIYIPLYHHKTFGYKAPAKTNYSSTKINFTKTLLTKKTDPMKRNRDQNVVVELAIARIESHRSAFLACHTGFGKTLTATYLIAHFKLKAMIMCHFRNIKQQFGEEIIAFTSGAKIQYVKGKKLDPDANIYICGIRKALSFSRAQLTDIGLVIIDEAHICTATAFSETLLLFQPWAVIGLSATPDRVDGLEGLLFKHFGPKKDFIIREEVKDFTVIRKWTDYEPKIEYTTYKGQLIIKWTDVITSLAVMEERWTEIAEDAIEYKDDKIIILCDRISMVKNIYNYLVKKGENADYLYGGKEVWDKTCRILIAGVKKGGVGLNDPKLTLLMLACDTKDVRQCEGRIRTLNNTVIDYRDNYCTLDSHGRDRDKWYLKRGAKFVDVGIARHNNKKSETPTRFLAIKENK